MSKNAMVLHFLLSQRLVCVVEAKANLPPNAKTIYGISNSPLAATSPGSYFSRKVFVTVGQLDNNSNDPSVRHNTQSDAQGLNRLDRSIYFFQKSQAYATTLNTTFNWEYKVVPNAGHDSQLLMQDAINLLFK